MNSNLKIALALVALVAAVVGVTIITQYTDGGTTQPPVATGGPQPDGATVGMPLVYDEAGLAYVPLSPNYAAREFPGFFEVNKEVHWATYLLRNVGSQPVYVSARNRSCTACSQARLAVLMPDENKAVTVDTGAAAAVGGLFPRPPETDLYHRAEDNKLNWQPLDFEHPDATLTVPAAVDANTPTWCVLQLGFEVKQTGEKVLSADIGMATDPRKVPAIQKFYVAFHGDPPARVDPKTYDFGTVGEKSEPKTVELFYWSSTRTAAQLAPPTVTGIAGDPFVATAAPVPLTPTELDFIARRVSSEKVPTRARSGYKIGVTLRRDAAGARELDIGPFERTLNIAGSDGTAGGQVQLTATVAGLVALVGGGTVELGDFPSKAGTAKIIRLTSEKADLALEPVNGGTGDARDRNPAGVTVTAEGMPETKNGRRQWAFAVTVGPNAFGGPIVGRCLVFRATATGQLIRLPIAGTAR